VSGPLILAEAAAARLSSHRAGIWVIVAGVVIIVLGVLRLFRLLPILGGRNSNPVLVGGVTILAGLALVVLGIVFRVVR
jgi:hypothetical protein